MYDMWEVQTEGCTDGELEEFRSQHKSSVQSFKTPLQYKTRTTNNTKVTLQACVGFKHSSTMEPEAKLTVLYRLFQPKLLFWVDSNHAGSLARPHRFPTAYISTRVTVRVPVCVHVALRSLPNSGVNVSPC